MIVVAGPPGVGKSTVAKLAAARLHGTALDLDRYVETRLGRTVPNVIRENGEAAFRAAELDALSDVSGVAVVSLGGGTLVPVQACRVARGLGPVCGLVADPKTLDRRIEDDGIDRPLMTTKSEVLLDARREAYASVDLDVATNVAPERVADDVVQRTSDLRTLVAHVGSNTTRVLIGRDLVEAVRGAVAAARPTRPVVMILDVGVPAPRRQRIIDRVASLYPVVSIEVPGGEATKTWASLEAVMERALEAGAGRQSVVVGVGGGATTDFAALVGSLLGRGAPTVLVPTTVLAQVDASVGGKCAINSGSGRNLIGAFHPATDVIVDLDFLASLSQEEARSGLAEMLKMGIIADAGLFDRIVESGRPDVESVTRTIELKAQIVAEDPFEQGRRKVLNLGHTLAHALESASDHTLRHGEAVAIGICAAVRFSLARGWASKETCERIVSGISRVGLPIASPEGLARRTAAFLGQDKKGGGTQIDFIAVHGLENLSIHALRWEEIRRELIRQGERP